jgi:hypothetical protein
MGPAALRYRLSLPSQLLVPRAKAPFNIEAAAQQSTRYRGVSGTLLGNPCFGVLQKNRRRRTHGLRIDIRQLEASRSTCLAHDTVDLTDSSISPCQLPKTESVLIRYAEQNSRLP